MNPALTRLRGALTKNKTALAALGVVAVAGLAWRARSESTTAPTSSTTTTTDNSYSAGGQLEGATGGAGYYDSTASDVYNALQPQLESVGAAVADLRELFTTIPVPDPSADPHAAKRAARAANLAAWRARAAKSAETRQW